ncbi:MAG: redoxin domain-containing protein [Acidimicrobiia bacterium]|nr:redoxin domain-containing protein [Acidimicrobiia bacterium]
MSESQRGSRMVWAVIVGGVLFIALGIVFAGRFGSDPTVSSSPLIGQPAPTGEIALMDGSGEVTVADHAGDIVVVNFWASWCLGCRTEHGALMQAAADYADFGTTFIAVNYQDTTDGAERFLAELGVSPDTVYTVDEGSATAFEWGVLGLPETFFVDRNGVVVGKVSGPASYDLLAGTIDRIIVGEDIGEITTGEVENR